MEQNGDGSFFHIVDAYKHMEVSWSSLKTSCLQLPELQSVLSLSELFIVKKFLYYIKEGILTSSLSRPDIGRI